MLSPSVAGQALALDSMDMEQKRGVTINSANVSLYYEYENNSYLMNMIDTPGHIDFTGKVTRSLRAIDGAVVVIDAVEGVMTQTETVTRQALEERVRPLLLINKIDRLVKELRLSPDKLEAWLANLVSEFNKLIDLYAEPEYKSKWKISIQDSTVAFGSAKDKWGFTFGMAKKYGIKFSDIYDSYANNQIEEFQKKAPVAEAILTMVIQHHPPPHIAQKYRIPKIWHGDLDSEVGKALLNCDEKGPAVMMVTNINIDPQAGLISTGRLFSGSVNDGDTVQLIGSKRQERVQSVNIFMGALRETVKSVSAGNIPALLGLNHSRAGETVSTISNIHSFEDIQYVSEPVITMAIEAKHPRELPKLVDGLQRISIEDPNLIVKINEESGEMLIAGMGVLHLEVATTLLQDQGLEIITSQPLVNYRETIVSSAGPVMSKSPNRHNKIFMRVEPLSEDVIDLIRNGKITENTDKKTVASLLREQGWEADEAKGVVAVHSNGNLMVEVTKGVQFLQESMDSMRSGFEDAMQNGPLAYEYCRGLKIILHHYVPHEDPAHRTFAQLMPATRRAILGGLLSAQTTMLEPILGIEVKCPSDLIGSASGVIASKRGNILNIEQKGNTSILQGEIPASETFDIAESMRGATAGRAIWNTHFKKWLPVPSSILKQAIPDIRKRKGLNPEPPKVSEFIDKE